MNEYAGIHHRTHQQFQSLTFRRQNRTTTTTTTITYNITTRHTRNNTTYHIQITIRRNYNKQLKLTIFRHTTYQCYPRKTQYSNKPPRPTHYHHTMIQTMQSTTHHTSMQHMFNKPMQFQHNNPHNHIKTHIQTDDTIDIPTADNTTAVSSKNS